MAVNAVKVLHALKVASLIQASITNHVLHIFSAGQRLVDANLKTMDINTVTVKTHGSPI